MKRFLGLLFVAAILVSINGCGGGAPEPPADQSLSDSVELTYTTNCQPCHGTGAAGDGVASSFLTVPASDLTGLISKYGSFPSELVAMTIDGRAEVESHGTREMPIWGNIWVDPDGGPLEEERAAERIHRLVEYIRSIQVDPEMQTN